MVINPNIIMNILQRTVKTFLLSILIIINTGSIFGMNSNKYSFHKNGMHQSQLERIFFNAEVVDGEAFVNLPITALNKPFLWIRYDNDFFKHQFKHVIFSKHKNYVSLELPPIQSETGVIIPNEGASTKNIILGRFPILENGKDTTHLRFNITNLLFDEVLWDDKNEQVLKQNSFVDNINMYKDELVIQTTLTVASNGKSTILNIDFGFYQLPKPMHPRLFDHRMGFFTENLSSQINHNTTSSIGSIVRWRLEKKDPEKAISNPIKPITFVLSPKIPKKWRPFIKAGILEWEPAFEAAGFKNALVIKELSDGSTIENNIHTSVVRWLTGNHIRGKEDTSGSTVSTVIDWRSGEILKADILIRTSAQNLSDNYFIRCAPLDKRAQQYPFPDELTGELIQFLVAHETGHAFGIKDSNYGEYSYPIDMLRDEGWLKRMGHTASVMSYTRHNNVAQPEDSISAPLLIQKIGPADIYTIKWGYSKIQGTKEQEIFFLENLIRQQDTVPWYRYNISRYEVRGPGTTDEVVDNTNPVQSATLALKNMERVIKLLPKINCNKKDNALTQRLYDKTLNLWYNQMRQVMSLIGGYTIQYKSGGQLGNIFTPIPRKKQIQAMDFLLNNAFAVSNWISSPEVVERTGYTLNNDKISAKQTLLLLELIGAYRMSRLEYMEQREVYNGLTDELLLKLQSALFSESNHTDKGTDFRKIEMQAIYVDKLLSIIEEDSLNSKFNKTPYHYNQTAKGRFKNLLNQLRISIEESLKYNNTPMVHGHLSLLLQQINDNLD